MAFVALTMSYLFSAMRVKKEPAINSGDILLLCCKAFT